MQTGLSYRSRVIDNRSHFGWVVLVIALAVAGCGNGGSGSSTDTPLVVVTTSILGDVVNDLIGDDATVEVLIAPGVDPHDFEPSARQAASLRDADLVVANGLGLEAGLLATIDSARSDGATVIEVGDLIDPLPFAAPGHDDADHEDSEHDRADQDAAEDSNHDHGSFDPHFWHDPSLMAQALAPLADTLAEALPEVDRTGLDERVDQMVADLVALDAEIEAILEPIPSERRVLLTNHHTLGYFAHRYGFDIIGTIISGGDTMASPSAADLATLVGVIDAHQAPAIFVETVSSRALAETLAGELGFDVEVVELYSDALGPEGSDGETYGAMLRSNARRIADALR